MKFGICLEIDNRSDSFKKNVMRILNVVVPNVFICTYDSRMMLSCDTG